MIAPALIVLFPPEYGLIKFAARSCTFCLEIFPPLRRLVSGERQLGLPPFSG